MVYDAVVAGRKSPSFPEESDDLEGVVEAMRRITAGGGKSGRGMAQPVGAELPPSWAEQHIALGL